MNNEVSAALRRLVAERAYRVCEYCLVHAGRYPTVEALARLRE